MSPDRAPEVAYVGTPFEHDIFITYSHGSDAQGRPYLQAWSAKFVEALDNELRADRRFRNDLRIFLDKQHRPGDGIDPMSALTDQLKAQISGSAILVVLMSPDYLASKWCADERDWWSIRQTETGLPSNGRIAVVRIWPTDAEWPTGLMDGNGQQLVGFSFFSDTAGVSRPIGWTDLPGPFGSEFNKALLSIVGRLNNVLETTKTALDQRRDAEANAAKLAAATGQSIYLHGRADQAEAWDRVAKALQAKNFAIFPGEPDPVEQDPARLQTIRERRVDMLTGCDALLLLGTADGRALDADMVVVGRNDRQSARARSNHLLPCGLLDTIGAPIATTVRKTTARTLQTDWLDATGPDWPTQIAPWLQSKSAQVRPA